MTATRNPSPTLSNAPRSSSSRLAFPVHAPGGRLVYLTAQQRALYLAVRWHIGRRRRARLTCDALAELAGYAHRGNVTRALDRLASFGLVGRHAIRGRAGEVRVWIPPRARAAAGARWVRNVAASTPFGGFISREELERRWTRGRSGASAARTAADGAPAAPSWSWTGPAGNLGSSREDRSDRDRLRRPPRVLYTRCPNGHRTAIERRSYSRGLLELSATWAGLCRRCRRPAREELRVALAGGQLAAPIGSRPWRAELEERHGAERVARFLEGLRAELEAGGAIRPPSPSGVGDHPRPADPACSSGGGIPR